MYACYPCALGTPVILVIIIDLCILTSSPISGSYFWHFVILVHSWSLSLSFIWYKWTDTTVQHPYLGQDSCSSNLTNNKFQQKLPTFSTCHKFWFLFVAEGQSCWFHSNSSHHGSAFCSNWSWPWKLYQKMISLFGIIV